MCTLGYVQGGVQEWISVCTFVLLTMVEVRMLHRIECHCDWWLTSEQNKVVFINAVDFTIHVKTRTRLVESGEGGCCGK